MSNFIKSIAANNANVLKCAASIAPIASHFVNKFLASHSDGDQSDFEAYVAAKVAGAYHAFFDHDDIISDDGFKEAVAYSSHADCDALLEQYREEESV
jgi:hypothetical protein